MNSFDAGAKELVNRLTLYIINPILLLLFAAGLLLFVYGVVQFMWGLSTENGSKEDGKRHMLWGIVGMFVMAAAYAIIKIVANTIHVPLPQ